MEFQGFQNSLPFLLSFLAIILLFGIAFFSYRNLKSIPLLPRASFIAIRFFALLILLLLIMNPYFFSSEVIQKEPKILVLLDDSESVTIQKGEYNGLDSYSSTLEELNLSSNSGIDVEYFTIGSNTIQTASPDSLSYNQTETNFSLSISQIQELEDGFDAGIIISDGIITFGRNPIIQASNLSIPLYTIALGDTSKTKDITLKNLMYNPSGFTNTRHIIEIEIAQNGFLNQSTFVKIVDSNGLIVDDREIQFITDEQTQSLSFEIELNEAGLQQFEVVVEALNDEWTIENNSSVISIDVSDSKTKILHVAYEIHPDVKMIRSILSSDDNIELSTLTWLGNNRYIESEIPTISEQELIIFHGLPPSELSISILDGCLEKPSLYLQLPDSRVNPRGVLSEIELISNTGNQLYQVNITPNLANTDHPIMELPDVAFDGFSPIISSLRSLSNSPEQTLLLKSNFQNIDTPNDILVVVERGNMRRAAISAWGWYRLYQSPTDAERDFVTQLFANIAAWSANNPDDRKLKISPSRPVFNISDEVIINANLNNENGELEAEATIEITIDDNNGDKREFNMSNEGDGAYQLSISSLSSGLYSFSAEARKGERQIDTQNGEFLVQDSNSELINTIRNDEFLRSLATETGGSFFTFNSVSNFWETLETDNLLISKEETIEKYTFPIHSFYWFIVVLLLLATEWVGRKFYSLP